MKKLIILVLAALLVLNAAAAFADPFVIDGLSPRNIQIRKAGLNPSAEEMIAQGISPTTGRALKEIVCPDGYAGVAATKTYQPIMVQISNSNNGIGTTKDGKQYVVAPVNGSCADVVYETVLRKGSATRMSMIFSDIIPDYAGFVRSTRATHARIRQEWDCAFCTSGYSAADVPKEWRAMGVKDPTAGTAEDPGIIYVGDVGINKPWKKYVRRLKDQKGPDNELFELVKILNDIIPADHVPANHTWRFTDELPSGGDEASIVYVSYGNPYNMDSRLEYDAENNVYIRYVKTENGPDLPYRDSTLTGAQSVDEKVNGKLTFRVIAEERTTGNLITFSNVIIQGITQKWKGADRPDPVLTGTGNADFFMGGKHLAGVWEREDYNSRTVFYGPDGNEIELQRGRTLIILMGYNDKGSNVSYE